jgi:hypothetical protein
MHNLALPLFYRDLKLVQKHPNVQVPQFNLLHAIEETPNVAPLVRSLDITEYQDPMQSSILPRVLSLLPRLRSLHLQLGEFKSLEGEEIHGIFFGLPALKTLAIENADGKADPSFLAQVLQGLEAVDQNSVSNISSLTCRSSTGPFHLLPSTANSTPFLGTDIFSNLLPRFPKLQVLDLANTLIDPSALFAISSSARLQYLRLSNCQENDVSTLARFLATHLAVKHSLVVFDGSGVQFGEQDTLLILENLPATLRSLNLSSSAMNAKHMPHLQKLCRHLEELSVGNGLSMQDVEAMILGPVFEFEVDSTPRVGSEQEALKIESEYELVLGPMRDAIAVCKLKRRLASVCAIAGCEGRSKSQVRYLDLSSVDEEEQGRTANSVLLGRQAMPLERIVVGGISGIGREEYRGLKKISGGCGWRDKWVGGKVWVERR